MSAGLTSFSFVRSLIIDPQTPTTLYLGSLKGIFKSTDGAASWTNMENGIQLPQAMSALAIDPRSTDVVYGASLGGGVFKRYGADSGWTPMNHGLTEPNVRDLAIDSQTPMTLYAGTDAGVFKSVDGAASWTQMNNGLNDTRVLTLALAPLTPTTLYAGTESGVFKRG